MMNPVREYLTKILPPAEPPHGLREAVFVRLERARSRAALNRFAVDSSIACVSAVAFVMTARVFLAEMSLSGASQYLSLFFTDTATTLAYWRESLLSLAASFPVLAAAAPLAAALALLYSSRRALIDGASAFHGRKLIA